MKIDNSMAKTFLDCGLKFQERYVHNLEPRRSSPALDFGTRIHQLLEERHKRSKAASEQLRAGNLRPDNEFREGEGNPYLPLPDSALEAEAQLTFAMYEAYYPEEPFEVVDVERYFEIPLPIIHCEGQDCSLIHHGTEGCPFGGKQIHHTYCGEMDGVIRMQDSGRLHLLETKTEQRNSKSNTDIAWAHKSQVALYLYAAEQIYNEEFAGITLNVLTRQSPKGQMPPEFRRHTLQRTRAQKLDAVKNITWVADQITECVRTGFFPSNRNHCVNETTGWACDFLPLHQLEGRPTQQVVDLKFQPAKEYLSGL